MAIFKKRIMERRFLLVMVLLAASLAAGVAGYAGDAFRPVQIRTKTLTMTGMRQAPPAEEPRDYQFTPVRVKTKPLTMTGMRD